MGLPEINRSNIKLLSDSVLDLGMKVHGLTNAENPPLIIEDKDFPNIKPSAPSGVIASALFRSIQVMWMYDPASYIATYQVFASKNAGFTPLESDMIWQGRSGAFNHMASVGETWYFRVRAMNTHGVVSEFSVEASASTINISGLEIEEKYQIDTITYANQYTADREIEIMNVVADKLDAQYFHDNIILKADVTFVTKELQKKLEQESVDVTVKKALDELVVTQDKIAFGAVGTNQLEAGSINEQKMKWAHHLIF